MFYIRMMIRTDDPEAPHLEAVQSGPDLKTIWKLAGKMFVKLRKEVPDSVTYNKKAEPHKKPNIILLKQ